MCCVQVCGFEQPVYFSPPPPPNRPFPFCAPINSLLFSHPPTSSLKSFPLATFRPCPILYSPTLDRTATLSLLSFSERTGQSFQPLESPVYPPSPSEPLSLLSDWPGVDLTKLVPFIPNPLLFSNDVFLFSPFIKRSFFFLNCENHKLLNVCPPPPPPP